MWLHTHTFSIGVIVQTSLKIGNSNVLVNRSDSSEITVFTTNNSHPVGHDEIDRCTLLSTVCETAEGAPCILLRSKFHAVYQYTVLTFPMALMIPAIIKAGITTTTQVATYQTFHGFLVPAGKRSDNIFKFARNSSSVQITSQHKGIFSFH